MYRRRKYVYFEDSLVRTPIILGYSCLSILLFFFAGLSSLSAQELNAEVKVNSSMVQGANRQALNVLEEALRTFINGRRWTDTPFRADERINCSFTLVITEAVSSNSFRGELYVQSHCPVEGSSYNTPLLNIRDKEMEFDYTVHQPLQFDPNFLQGNLTTIVAYYAYLILGLDLDSHSALGGTYCFRYMEQIVANAQSYGWKGWERSNNWNRSAIATTLNDGTLGEYRQMWFDYHRNGLDVTDRNGGPGLGKIVPSVLFLTTMQTKRPNNLLIRLFGDAKLEEIVNLLSRADVREKREAYEALVKLYPARNNELEQLRE